MTSWLCKDKNLSTLTNMRLLVNAYKYEITEKSHFLFVNGYKFSLKFKYDTLFTIKESVFSGIRKRV